MNERRLQVLRAIVQDYVSTSEPVGSKALLERHRLGVSAATVRNDMAVLEEEGLIAAPHTSAGRIPTDAGYRLFVDQLGEVKPLSRAERTAIADFLSGAVDLDDVVDRTVRLLSSLTQQVAVMQYPSLTRSSVRHIELVPIGGSRVMAVLIVTTGRVEQRVVDTGVAVDTGSGERIVFELRGRLNALAAGRPFTEVAAALPDLPTEPASDPEQGPDAEAVATAVTRALAEMLVEEREERVVIAGTANLARFQGDFSSLGPVLEALEEHVVLLGLLRSLAAEPSHGTGGLAVRIGHELTHEGLAGTSVITSGYGAGADLVAGLGVVGPTRMDYPSTMAAVRAVAAYVSRQLGS